jgi:adenylate kinase family enzyme
MTPLYVIGGKPQTGKSTISERIGSRHGLEILHTDSFQTVPRNDGLTWDRTVKHLRETNFPSGVVIEGVAITPRRIHELDIPALALQKAVFLGYSRESHAESILNHAKHHKNWVAKKIREKPSYVDEVRGGWMKTEIPESAQLKKDAEAYGCGYFDITDYSDFEKYMTDVADYLLTSSKDSPKDSSCEK